MPSSTPRLVREADRFGLAMDAIKLFHGEVSEDLLLKEKKFEALRRKLLRGAADFYGKLEGLLEGQTDRASRRAMGDAYFELGNLTDDIGDKTAALTAHRKGLAVRRGSYGSGRAVVGDQYNPVIAFEVHQFGEDLGAAADRLPVEFPAQLLAVQRLAGGIGAQPPQPDQATPSGPSRPRPARGSRHPAHATVRRPARSR